MKIELKPESRLQFLLNYTHELPRLSSGISEISIKQSSSELICPFHPRLLIDDDRECLLKLNSAII